MGALLMTRLDLAFTLGRVFGLLPVMILSHMVADQAALANRIAAYQVALFLSTLVLYGAPQVYLVKRGIERRVFVAHMAISGALVAVGLAVGALLGWWAGGLVMPFLFLVCFRSYYLLLASYLKFDAGASLILIGVACATLAAYALTLSYAVGMAVAVPLMLWLLHRLGYLRMVYARVALRRYLTLLMRNFGYFYNFLLQQTNTQITLAIYAFVASGDTYLQAAHGVYIYAISFIFHGILFRLTLANMSQSRGVGVRREVGLNLALSLGVGLVGAILTLAFYAQIERTLFGSVQLDRTAALMLALMILLNASNFGWAALLTSARRPYALAAIGTLATCIVIAGIFVQDALAIPHGIFGAMLAGLIVQVALRTIVGLRLLRRL